MKQHHKNKCRNITGIAIYHQEKEAKFFCWLWHLPSPNYHPKKWKKGKSWENLCKSKKRKLEENCWSKKTLHDVI